MTLDEAIIHAKELSENQSVCKDCREEHKQLAAWLDELKQYKEKNEHFKDNVETNFEHYKDGIIELCIDELAISKGKIVECDAIPCSECDFEDKNGHCIGNHEIMKWLKQPYKKPKYKFTQFEYDLINTYSHIDDRCKFNGCYQLKSLKEKGYFKNVDKNELIKDIIENCEVV